MALKEYDKISLCGMDRCCIITKFMYHKYN